MFIDINQLDKEKTYICNEIGTSFIAKIIQNLEHRFYKNTKSNSLASHTFLIRFKNNKWMIVENHKKWNGVKEYFLDDYLKDGTKSLKNIEVYQHKLNNNVIDYYSSEWGNPSYSVMDLGNIAEERLIGLKFPNSSGMICSEFVLLCDNDFSITKYFKKPAHELSPSDIQYYFKTIK